MDCDREVINDRNPSRRADRSATADRKNAVTVRAARIRKPIPVVNTRSFERIVRPREANGSDSSLFSTGALALIPSLSPVVGRVQSVYRHVFASLDLCQKDLMTALSNARAKANFKRLKIDI